MAQERPGAIGRRSTDSTGYEDLRDPAKGEKVPRCAVCGIPASPVIVGVWSGDGKTYRIRVCDRCIARESRPGPEDADPLTVPEAA